MRRIALSAVLVPLGLAAVLAQDTSQSGVTRFEVASIRPCQLEGVSLEQFVEWARVATPSGIRYYRPCTNVRELITFAYNLPLSRVRGAPDWTIIQFFRIEARAPEPVDAGQMRLLVRQLLADRFALRSHTEAVDERLYRLVLANPASGLGPNATPTAAGCTVSADAPSITPAPATPKGGARCNTSRSGRSGDIATRIWTGMTMAQFAESLPVGSAVVVDETGVDGVFDLTISYLTNDQRPRGVGAGIEEWRAAMEPQLGLKLDSALGPVEVLVIDSVQQPTEN